MRFYRVRLFYGCIRDAAEIGHMAMGVKALATNPRRGDRQGRCEVDLALEFFRPGGYLYSDEDGILLAAEPLI